MKVSLVTHCCKPITVGVGSHTFPIEDGEVKQDDAQRLGCQNVGKSHEYNAAYGLAVFAWKHQLFDDVEAH